MIFYLFPWWFETQTEWIGWSDQRKFSNLSKNWHESQFITTNAIVHVLLCFDKLLNLY